MILQLETARPKETSALRWYGAVAAIMLAALALRCAQINTHSFWYDEATTAKIIKQSFHQLAFGGRKDAGNPALYWLVMRCWAGWFGDSETALRSFSVVCGTLCIPLIAILGRRLFSPATGWVAAVLLAISPLSIELSNEARCYALLHLLVLLNMLLFLRWIELRRFADWAGYSLTTFLACYCHYYAFTLPMIQFIVLMAVPKYRRLGGAWVGGMAIAGARFWLPWLPAFWQQLHQPGNLSRMGERWPEQFVATPLAFSLGRTFAWSDSAHWLLGIGLGISVLIFGGLAVYGWTRLRNRHLARALCAAWILVPIVLPLLAAIAGKPIYHHRYASVGMPAFLLLVAWGLRHVNPGVALVAAIAIVGSTTISLWRYATIPLKDDWRDATPVILANADSTPVLFDTPIEILSMEYYIRDPARIPSAMFELNKGLTADGELWAERHTPDDVRDPSPQDYTQQLLSSPHICLVLCVPVTSPANYQTYFTAHGYNLAKHWAFHRIDVLLFDKASSQTTGK